MSTETTGQLTSATALVQLLAENPDLPVAGWSINSVIPELHGHLHEGGMDALRAYAEVLGGCIRPGQDYKHNGVMVRPHRLSVVWRDVPVTLAVTLPAPVAVRA